jgi:hypothetical protein
LRCSCSVSSLSVGDSAISRSQHEGTVIQHRRLGPTSHPRRVRPTQAQLKVGSSVHRQAGYKTRVISTTISRGPRCSELLEHSEPAQVLPVRGCPEIADLWVLRWFFLLNQFGGHVSQDLGCKFLYEHTEATATCMFHINRLLIMSFTEVMATFISYRLHDSTEASAPFMLFTNRLPPRPWMVAHDKGRSYSNKDRSVQLVYTQFVGWARMKSYFDYILSRCTQGSFIFCQKHGRPAAMPAPAPNKFDPFVRFFLNSWSVLV